LGCDSSFAQTGWYVDTVSVSVPVFDCCRTITPPTIVNVRRPSANQVAFSYATSAGNSYIVETRNSLTTGSWTAIQTNLGTGGLLSYTNSSAGSAAFFRLRVQ
jgi:hypothetical protein